MTLHSDVERDLEKVDASFFSMQKGVASQLDKLRRLAHQEPDSQERRIVYQLSADVADLMADMRGHVLAATSVERLAEEHGIRHPACYEEHMKSAEKIGVAIEVAIEKATFRYGEAPDRIEYVAPRLFDGSAAEPSDLADDDRSYIEEYAELAKEIGAKAFAQAAEIKSRYPEDFVNGEVVVGRLRDTEAEKELEQAWVHQADIEAELVLERPSRGFFTSINDARKELREKVNEFAREHSLRARMLLGQAVGKQIGRVTDTAPQTEAGDLDYRSTAELGAAISSRFRAFAAALPEAESEKALKNLARVEAACCNIHKVLDAADNQQHRSARMDEHLGKNLAAVVTSLHSAGQTIGLESPFQIADFREALQRDQERRLGRGPKPDPDKGQPGRKAAGVDL